jgi:hypothetical protein
MINFHVVTCFLRFFNLYYAPYNSRYGYLCGIFRLAGFCFFNILDASPVSHK